MSLLQELGGEGHSLNRNEFLKELQIAYGFQSTSAQQNDEAAVRIFLAIIRQRIK
jgi:hypothetical protein